MGNVIVKIKDENVICELGKPNFKCQVQGVVINSTFDTQAYFDALPSYANDTEARADGLTTNDLYWFSADTDTGIYNTLKRVSPL
jgi:hypothetical protein